MFQRQAQGSAKCEKLKDTGTFIYQDFSKATIELRKSLWEEVVQISSKTK